MTIEEQLNAINNTFVKLHNDFLRFDEEKKNLSAKLSPQQTAVHEKYAKERGKLTSLKEDVLTFYRIAKDNSKKELRTNGVMEIYPDIARLNEMIDGISPYSEDDPVAGQVIELAGSYIAYINKKIADVDSAERSEMNGVSQCMAQENARLSQEKNKVFEKCKAYLQGGDIANLVSLFERIHRDYEITDSFFKNYGNPTKRKLMMLYGFRQFPVDVPKVLCDTLKGSLGHHFDKSTKMVNCPCGFTTNSYEDIFVEYTEANENSAKKGIQALILNFIRYFPPTELKVSVFDYIHYNADVLGPLGVFTNEKNSFMDKVPSNGKTLKQYAAILAEYYHKVESKIGSMSVYQYNAQHDPGDRIPLRILIINRQQDHYSSSDEGDTAYIVNNAAKFGVTVVRMFKSADGGSKGKDREKKYLVKSENRVHIISDSDGKFYVENNAKWLDFKWLDSPDTLPADFVERIKGSTKKKEIGTKYFSRYSMTVPVKSHGKRRPITVPFAIDSDDRPISCSFENDLFAAYIMGAAGSGKSTLLHTIISGLIMNYHPDEVELWLMDFKMLEFKRYVKHTPPHVKYILLEKSEDLVFDIIDNLTELLNKREHLFSQNGWYKLTDVPPEANIPAIFVIIDEFAQMSQIIKETRGSGHGGDYTIKLENLLAKGRALGIKFIFASQTYTTGISGLTDTACKQIQMRFALKNTPEEIKQTLSISSDLISEELNRSIAAMPAYETIFKWLDKDNSVHIDRYRNMYTLDNEVETLIDKINNSMKPAAAGSKTGDTTYIQKSPVMIDGAVPKTFAEQIHKYKEYEKSVDPDAVDDGDILIYAGVPCSFNPVRPFTLCSASAENILAAGGDRDNTANVVLSIMKCYARSGNEIEIWAHKHSPIFKRYKATVFSSHTQVTQTEEICKRIARIKNDVINDSVSEKLIICFGYENLAADFEILGDEETAPASKKSAAPKPQDTQPDMNEILRRCRECTDPEEKNRLIAEYNRLSAGAQNDPAQDEDEDDVIYDAREDMKWIIRRAPSKGVHFLMCFEQAQDFISLHIDEKLFKHKILFPMPYDESLSIMGNRKASEIGDGTCIYSSGKKSFTLRPHLFRGVPCNGWIIDNNGKAVREGKI